MKLFKELKNFFETDFNVIIYYALFSDSNFNFLKCTNFKDSKHSIAY